MGTTIYSGLNKVVGSSSSGTGLTEAQEILLNTVPSKANTAYVDEGLAEKSDINHTHEITEINSLNDELNNRYTKLETLSTTEINDLIAKLQLGMSWKSSVSTKTDLDALTDSVNGDARIVTDEDKIYVYDGSHWIEIGASSIVNVVTSTQDGLMLSTDKTKLDSIVISDLITQAILNTILADYSKKTDLDSYLKSDSLNAGDNIEITDNGDGTLTIASTASAISATYSELKTLKSRNKLIAGQKYLLTDYATKYRQPTSNIIKTMSVEPLLLTASSTNSFEPIAFSPSYPQDVITYDFTNDKCEDDSTARNGFILQRYDTQLNIDFPNDWRNIVWYRDGSDVKTFGNNCYNIVHKGIKSGNLVDTVFGRNCMDMSFGVDCFQNTFGNNCLQNTFDDSCHNNTFKTGLQYNRFNTLCYNNIFGSSFVYNSVGVYCCGNTFGNNTHFNNIGSGIRDNTFPYSMSKCIVNSLAGKDISNITDLQGGSVTKTIDQNGTSYYYSYISSSGTLTITKLA